MASVAPEVKMSSSFSQPSSCATLLPRQFHGFVRPQAEGVGAGSVGVFFGEEGQHGFQHAGSRRVVALLSR